MASFRRILLVALAEWCDALRSRRALVLFALYLITSALCMYGTISVLAKMEREIASLLALPADGPSGIVTESLWRSESFRRLVSSAVGDSLVFNDLLKHHPVELLYAWFAFLLAPMLVVLVSGGRIAGERQTGSVRYMLMRVTRFEWSVGKYAGQAILVASALVASAFVVWAIAWWRLPSSSAAGLLVPVFCWSVKAWVYSLSWLGLALGLSHLMRSTGKVTALCLVFIVAFAAFPNILEHFAAEGGWQSVLLHFKALVPSGAERGLWRDSPVSLVCSSFHLVTLGLVYLMAGAAVFARRDA